MGEFTPCDRKRSARTLIPNYLDLVSLLQELGAAGPKSVAIAPATGPKGEQEPARRNGVKFMYPIFRENLFRDLFDFRQDFDELFNRMLGGFPVTTEPTLRTIGFTPLADVWIDPDVKKFYLRIALPGVDPKDVKVEFQGTTLRIAGERKTIETKKEVNFLNREFTYGTFERVLPLPEGVDVEKLVAEFNHGVLEISAPMVTAALPRRIEIQPALKKVA